MKWKVSLKYFQYIFFMMTMRHRRRRQRHEIARKKLKLKIRRRVIDILWVMRLLLLSYIYNSEASSWKFEGKFNVCGYSEGVIQTCMRESILWSDSECSQKPSFFGLVLKLSLNLGARWWKWWIFYQVS